MIVVDTSAVVAIIRKEPGRRQFLERLADAVDPKMSAVTWMESQMVVFSRLGEHGLTVLRQLKTSAGVDIVPVSSELADLAFAAFRRFGKGRHPASLNFGDCFAYALSKQLQQPLLFKGEDFARTDAEPAIALS